MNKYTVLLSILLCIASVTARHYVDKSEAESSDDRDDQDSVRRPRDRVASQMRHRRRSWQMNYGYDYPQPPNPYYPDNRREYEHNQQDLIPQILRLLDEITSYVKRPQQLPPPPPQPIYVPYPVPYSIPQQCSCPVRRVNVTSRFPDMEDTNQNWGFADINNEAEEEEGDGSRPISFVPIVPQQKPKRPPPKVDHGTSQAKIPNGDSSSSQARLPGACEVFSLSCCSGTAVQQRDCFINVGCSSTYDNGNACNQDRILAIIEAYSKAYSPVNIN